MAFLFCSCQKEGLTDAAVNNTALSSASASARQSLTGVNIFRNPNLNYGALICPPSPTGWLDFQTNVAGQLGISCLRSSIMVPGIKANVVLGSGYNVLLNFNTNNDSNEGDDEEEDAFFSGLQNGFQYNNNPNSRGGNGGPTPFVTNLAQYKIDLSNTLLLSTIKPAVAVIENEESNKAYYIGSPVDYLKQLNAAISVMHYYGIKVANGGVTRQGLEYMVYQDFMKQGKYDSAKLFQQLSHVTPNNPYTQERGNFVDTLLGAYAQMNLDYVNFHWKGISPDTEELKEVIAYIKKRTGKPVINNELGQFDRDPSTLLAEIQLCTDENFPYIIWYSPDENDGRRATPLQYDDGSLTPTGSAYQDYLAN